MTKITKKIIANEQLNAPVKKQKKKSFDVVTFFVCNLLTIGIYGTVQTVRNLNRLSLLQKTHKKQCSQLLKSKTQWEDFDKNGVDLFINNDSSIEETRKKSENLSKKLKFLKDQNKKEFKYNEKALAVGIIVRIAKYIKCFILNLVTLSIYTNIINYNINKKITHINNERIKLKKQFLRQTTIIESRVEAILGHDKNRAELRKSLTMARSDDSMTLSTLEKERVLKKNNELEVQVGPIPPQYFATEKDGTSSEAFGLALADRNRNENIATKRAKYKKKYSAKLSSEEVFKKSFGYVFKSLLKIANNPDRMELGIKKRPLTRIYFNRSKAIIEHPVLTHTVLRLVVLDILSGGKVVKQKTGGFAVQINKHLRMLPSQSEKILEKEELTKLPKISWRYRQRDDFTPTEDVLQIRNGVDPVAICWIGKKLEANPANLQHLFNLLMEPFIEDNDPAYVATNKFMKNHKNPNVQLIQTAFNLILDLTTAMQKRFDNVLIDCWQKYANEDEEVFIKEQNKIENFEKLDTNASSSSNEEVVWELDETVLQIPDCVLCGEMMSEEEQHDQATFASMIKNSKVRYQEFFLNQKKLISFPNEPRPAINSVIRWKLDSDTAFGLNQQYHVSHQMIGESRNFEGGARCLFSNLLAVFATKKSDLTMTNVQCLKFSMAAYLEKLSDAKFKWSQLLLKGDVPNDAETNKLKKMSEQADRLEQEIMDTHKCDLRAYQMWLVGSTSSFKNPARIELNNLTILEIEIAAWTLGIKIGVLPIGTRINNKVDENGRIVPTSFFGPNTKEYLLMAHNKDSFHGLFPRFEIDHIREEEIINSENLKALRKYWISIDTVMTEART